MARYKPVDRSASDAQANAEPERQRRTSAFIRSRAVKSALSVSDNTCAARTLSRSRIAGDEAGRNKCRAKHLWEVAHDDPGLFCEANAATLDG